MIHAAGETGNQRPIPYHLRIGVAGHRNLRDPEAVKQAVERMLDEINSILQPQARTPLSWTIVSPLAKGADRIVAAAVLKRRPSTLEFYSPFAVDEYRRDFTEDEDREEFEKLFAQAEFTRCVVAEDPPPPPSPDADADAEAQTNWRNRGYLRCGRAVVDACEILIVVWDGGASRGLGGTADVVTYALKQQRTVVWINAADPSQPPRLVVGWRPGSPPQTREFPRTAKELAPGYHQLDAYNRDDAVLSEELTPAVRDTCKSLRDHAVAAGIEESTINAILDVAAPHYARADRLAVHYRNRYFRATTALYYLSAAAVTVVVGQVLLFPNAVWLILFEILAMGTAVGLWLWSRQAAWHEKWIHDRYLSERIRMVLFTLPLGLSATSSEHAPQRTLAFYGGPQHWLLSAVNDMATRISASGRLSAPFSSSKRFLIDGWLKPQREYHLHNSRRKLAATHRGHRLGVLLFVLTLIMAVLHFAGVGHAEGDHHAAGVMRPDAWITFFAIVLPVWGAAMHAITNQLELERIGERSKRMARVLDLLIERAEETESADELRDVVAEGLQVMGTENYEWWILLSFRQPVLPV